MYETPESWLEHAIAYCIAWAVRLSWVVVVVAVALTVWSAWYVARHLSINTNRLDMLSAELPWRQTQLDYRRTFPQYSDTIAVVIDGQTADQAEDAARELTQLLRQRSDLFSDVFNLLEEPHFRHNQLLYLDTGELGALIDQLAAAQPFLARLSQDPSLVGLARLLTQAQAEEAGDAAAQLAPAFERIATVVDAVNDGRNASLSWQEMMTGHGGRTEDRRRVILVKPVIDYSELLPGKSAVLAIRALVAKHGFDARRGVRVRLTGSAAMGYEELDSVARGAESGAVLSFVLVALCLVLGLRSFSLIFATLVVLAMGLIQSAAFAAWAVGSLNMISVAFAVLYVGLAVAYAIHYVLRVRELLLRHERNYALVHAGIDVGGSIVLCALTTAIGFYSFLPTDYQGVAELGLIAGTSMLIGLALSLTVLPALLALLPLKPVRTVAVSGLLLHAADFPQRHARAIVASAGLLAIASLLVLPHAQFDRNPLHLQDPRTESVQTFRDLLAESARSPYSISIVAADAATANALKQRLAALPSVDSAISIDDFVPAHQEEKLALIENLDVILGPDLARRTAVAVPSADAQLNAVRALHAALQNTGDGAPAQAASIAHLRDATGGLLARIDANPETADAVIGTLRVALLGTLPARLERLRDALQPQTFTQKDLPEALRERWIAADGRRRVEVLPRENLDDNSALNAFVGEVRSVAGSAATDTPVIILEAGNSVVYAFQEALLTAVVAIALLLWVILRNLREVLLALAPLILAGLLTVAVIVVGGMKFNFANVIALPLLLGVGVDNGLHILHRYRTGFGAEGHLLTTSTGLGVLLSSLTTACGFGNLALSPHLGTASMGMMLTIGLGLSLVSALVVLPAMLTLWPLKRREARAA